MKFKGELHFEFENLVFEIFEFRIFETVEFED